MECEVIERIGHLDQFITHIWRKIDFGAKHAANLPPLPCCDDHELAAIRIERKLRQSRTRSR